jgi:putative sigma-54 modulation protein
MDKIEIKAIHSSMTRDIEKYTQKKMAKLDAFIPRQVRKSSHAEVRLSESKTRDKKRYTAEVNLYLPGETIMAKETTVNMYAAVDIIEEKLKTQLRRYKAARSAREGHKEAQVRRFLGKIIRKK